MVDEIRTLYAYSRWATGRLLAAARGVSPEAFVREVGVSHGSLRGTLVHLVWAEWIWLERWRGRSPKTVFTAGEFRDVDAIAARWRATDHDQRAFLADLTDEQLAARLSYDNLQGERWEYTLAQMMRHVANHSSYHRGQVAAVLRQLGHTPPPTDLLVFVDEGAPEG